MTDDNKEVNILEGLEIPKLENGTEQPDLMKNMSFNRKFRRMLLKQSGYVKYKNKLLFKDWFENIKNNITNGKQLHALNTDESIKKSSDFFDRVNESTSKFLIEKGYSEERVSEILEENMNIQERIQIKKIKK